MSPFEGFLLFLTGYPLICLVSLLGLLGCLLVLKLNGSPKLALGLIIVPLGIVLLIQLIGLIVASSPNSITDILKSFMFLVILLPVLVPTIYVRRKLSQKYSLSQDESRKAIILYIIFGFIAGLVMGLLAFTLDKRSEDLDPILFLIILPLIMTALMTFVGWLSIRQFSKSPSRIAYILPDWLLQLFDPFYIPPYGKKRNENKTRKN